MNIENLKNLYEEAKNNINNFDEILVVKNYKEMCKILEEEETTGNSKKAQQKKWARYFEFTKDEQKYIINDIYENELPKNTYISPYDTLNELIICEKIIEHMENPKYKDKRYICSMTKLARDLGYVNDLFIEGYNHPKKMAQEIFGEIETSPLIEKRAESLSKYDIQNKSKLKELNENSVYEIYNIIPKRYKDRIQKTLKRLQSECVISVNIIDYGILIKPKQKQEAKIEVVTDRYGDQQVNYIYEPEEEFRPLTDIEANKVQAIKNNILQELGLEKEEEIYRYKKDKIYYNKLKTELAKMGFKNVTKCFVLAFAENYIYQKRDKLRESQKKINKLFIDKSLRNSAAMAKHRIAEIEKQRENETNAKENEIYETEIIEQLSEKEIEKRIKYYQQEKKKRDILIKYFLEIPEDEE